MSCPEAATKKIHRKSTFLFLRYQISVGMELSGSVHYGLRASLTAGARELLLGMQHPHVTRTCPWGTSQGHQKPPVRAHRHRGWLSPGLPSPGQGKPSWLPRHKASL